MIPSAASFWIQGSYERERVEVRPSLSLAGNCDRGRSRSQGYPQHVAAINRTASLITSAVTKIR
jgi:hypothetical protein